jgi:hypothetical protein
MGGLVQPSTSAGLIGNVPPVEFEQAYNEQLKESAMVV